MTPSEAHKALHASKCRVIESELLDLRPPLYKRGRYGSVEHCVGNQLNERIPYPLWLYLVWQPTGLNDGVSIARQSVQRSLEDQQPPNTWPKKNLRRCFEHP